MKDVKAALQLVDEHGRRYLTADERRRTIAAAAHAKKPADQTFVRTFALTGARVGEVPAPRTMDVDLAAGAVRILTLTPRDRVWRRIAPCVARQGALAPRSASGLAGALAAAARAPDGPPRVRWGSGRAGACAPLRRG
ncbi:MAG: hypothetical protein F4Y02_04105 [Chloroflexi bacterium]|nr:hypothetical protein [Chloroflexota bacterium]